MSAYVLMKKKPFLSKSFVFLFITAYAQQLRLIFLKNKFRQSPFSLCAFHKVHRVILFLRYHLSGFVASRWELYLLLNEMHKNLDKKRVIFYRPIIDFFILICYYLQDRNSVLYTIRNASGKTDQKAFISSVFQDAFLLCKSNMFRPQKSKLPLLRW